ncbi:MAG: phosphotransferase [Deltaproteobacteria bacterium]|nr:phosphotransferase [Deltaproteobacteria bacterium]MBW2087265.1 phosphotransferase [Deltaproteobacteria bacterium]
MITMNMEEIARKVAQTAYGLDSLIDIKHLPQGRVNLTFLVRTPREAFVLQRLHPVFGKDGAVVQNMVAVTARLAAKGVPVPRVVRTRNGDWWVEEDGLWRLMTFLPGRPPERRSVKAGAEAACSLGRFHRVLAEDPPHLAPLPPADHNRDAPASPHMWDSVLTRYEHRPRFERAAPVLKKGRTLARRLPQFSTITQAILHGDPKMENFLFDENGVVSGLIDLDIVRPGTLLWELADALRSWAGISGPGDQTALSQDIFVAAVSSYRQHGLDLSPEEWSQLPAATRAVALDLARRYLTDFFEESYFAWDRDQYPSLAEQNLRRGTSLVRLAEDLESKEQTLVELIGS